MLQVSLPPGVGILADSVASVISIRITSVWYIFFFSSKC